MKLPTLFRRGDTWWVRLVHDGQDRRVSTGTSDATVAQGYVLAFYKSAAAHQHVPAVRAVIEGRIPLRDFGAAFYAGTMGEVLRRALTVDLEPHVARWLRHLKGKVAEATRREYDSKVRSLIPPGVPFYSDGLTIPAVRDWLDSLISARTDEPVSSTTRRHYFDALRAFLRWAKQDGLVPHDVLAGFPVPSLNQARRRVLEYPELRAALDAVAPGPPRAALFAIAGTGMEQQAIQRVHGRDIIRSQPVLGRTVNGLWAHGSKNGYRDRLVFCREWAWGEVAPFADAALPTGRVFDCGEDWIRRAWRDAQLAAKVADEETRLSVHDLRHCFCVMVSLGTDGEPRMDLQYQADQLGHGTTVMVSRIYGWYRLSDRLRAIDALEAERARFAAPPALTLHRGAAGA
jgi:integrase